MKTRYSILFAATMSLLLLCTSLVKAQERTGTISGTVSDPTGAMIPKAQVTISNEGTGLKRTVLTNDAGFFTVPDLPVGTYSVSASASGFKTGKHTGIDLHVADQKVVPVTLQVGTMAETVEVTGGATLVETRSGEVSSLVGPQQMAELPLNGRSFVQLTLLAPGAAVGDNTNTRNTGLLAGVDISMSGNSANTNAWLVDGVDNVDHGSGRTILVYPSIDSIEEFKVRRNSYGADSPAAGGAQINLVTKSGSNRFHGSVYEFFRNDKLQAANFFLNSANQKKGELRYNNWGYTIGGPIKKDKAFFFWSEEWRREIRGITRQATVPSVLERQGNFSGPLSGNLNKPTDPFTGAPFPGDQIPACASGQRTDCLSPAGLAILKLYPLPNVNRPLNNWVQAIPTRIPTRQEQIRGDLNISQKTTLMGRYTQDYWANPAPNTGGEGGLWGDTGFPTVDSTWDQPGKNFGARVTHTFGPSMINETQFTYSNNRIHITPGLGQDINTAANNAIPTVFPALPAADRVHAIFWGAPPTGKSLWNIAPWDNSMDLYSLQDDLTMARSKHTIKTGFLYSWNTKREDSCCGHNPLQFWGPTAVPGGAGVGGGWGDANAPGNGGRVTGNGIADLLLKGTYFGGSEQDFLPRFLPNWKNIEFYGADTFRVTSRLTLDYGVRWSFLPAEIQDDSQVANFVPSLYDPAVGSSNPLNGLIFPTTLSLPNKGIQGGAANLRGIDVGKALVKNHNNLIAPRFGFAWDPTGAGKWAIRGAWGFFFGRADLSHPIAELVNNPPFASTLSWGSGRPLDFVPASLPTAGVGTASNAADINGKVGGSYQWNFTIERQLARDTKIEVSYVGNRGHHLPYNYNLNDVPPQSWLEYARRNYASQSDPVSKLNKDALRPLFALKGNNSLIYQTYGANSSYHSLQVFLTKRFSRSYSFQTAYTWSKSLANTSLNCCGGGNGSRLASPLSPNYDRGLSDFDRTHILTLNSIYHFPTLAGRSGFLRTVLGGWETTGIYSYSSGIPLTPHLNTNLVGVDGNASIRPDLVVSGGGGPRNADQWFDPLAFAMPVQLGRLGFGPRGSVRAPALNNMDFSIYKNFKLKWENSRIQFRFETFNTLNHTQLQNVDMNYNVGGLIADTTRNVFTTCGAIAGNTFPNCNTNATFGKPIRSRDPREIQFALKFIF